MLKLIVIVVMLCQMRARKRRTDLVPIRPIDRHEDSAVVLEDMVLVSRRLEDPKKSLGLGLGLVTKVLGLGLGLDKMVLVLVLVLRLKSCNFQDL